MSGFYLSAQVAGAAVAIHTDEIEAVVRLKDISPVPGVAGAVVGLSALRSRVLTVVDTATLISGKPYRRMEEPDGGYYAITSTIDGHSYGLLVDKVNDVVRVDTEPFLLRGRVDGLWEPHVRGVVEYDGNSCFLLSVPALFEWFMQAQAA